jgi:hypothetical protein
VRGRRFAFGLADLGMAAGRTPSALLLAVAIALAATACSGSGYTYVSSQSTKTFLKVPDDWTVYDRADILEDDGPLRPVFDESDHFGVRFDAAPKPSLDHGFFDARYPVGLVRVRPILGAERDQYSIASLRNELLQVDALLEADEEAVELHSAKELNQEGLRGGRLEYTVHLDDDVFTIAQIGMVDATTERVWILLVGCEATCYERHSEAIHRVLDSWTVEGK